MPSKIASRIVAETGIPRLFEALSEDLPLSDLQSLLLEVYQARTAALDVPDLLARAERGLMAPSKVDARLLNLFDQVAFEVAGRFEAIELSPVGPLGLNRVLGAIDQNNVLTTIRNAEVLGDATMAMALECWRRRRESSRGVDTPVVRLCSSQRMIRLQPFDVPGFVPHFRLFSLVSAGRDTGSNAFEIEHMGEHIRFFLELFQALNKRGFRFDDPLVEISDPAITMSLLESQGVTQDELRQTIRAHRPGGSERFLTERGVSLPHAIEDPARELAEVADRSQIHRLELLKNHLAGIRLRFNFSRLEGLAYYNGPCLRISPAAPDGNRYAIVDGGFTGWTARLLQNKKERLLTTGIGTEFACSRYRVL